MKFWDASAVIPLFLEEPETPRMLEIARQDSVMIAWWGTVVECRSAVARLGPSVSEARAHPLQRLPPRNETHTGVLRRRVKIAGNDRGKTVRGGVPAHHLDDLLDLLRCAGTRSKRPTGPAFAP